MRKRKLSLRRLFSNTKFLILFSIVVAFIFWIVVALEYAPVVENVIEGVPVQIDMENSVPNKLGLQIFGQKEYTIDITVKGNRYVVGGKLLTADDFDVTAQTAYVDSSGNHTLQLKVTTKDANADYQIVSVSSEYIEVYFDKYEEKEFEVTPRVNTKLASLTDDDYLFNKSDIIVTTPTVTLSGAQTEMDKIKAVYADIDINSKLTQSVTYDSKLSLDNGTKNEVKYVSINGESQLTVPITLPVYKISTLPVSVSFKNAPSDYLNKPLSYTCNPSSAKVAVLQNGSTSDKTVEVGTVDFNNLTAKNNTFTFYSSNLKDIKVLDSTTSFKVTVNVEDISSSELNLNKDNITVTGYKNNAAVNIDLSATGKISVSGSKSAVSALTDTSAYGKIDLTGVTLSDGNNKVPVTVYIKDSTNCWVTGTYYAEISVS
jgi:hypothetical protein